MSEETLDLNEMTNKELDVFASEELDLDIKKLKTKQEKIDAIGEVVEPADEVEEDESGMGEESQSSTGLEGTDYAEPGEELDVTEPEPEPEVTKLAGLELLQQAGKVYVQDSKGKTLATFSGYKAIKEARRWIDKQ
jgi:hypothetical protein